MAKTIGIGRRTGAFEVVFSADPTEGHESYVGVAEIQLMDCEHLTPEETCPDDSFRCSNKVRKSLVPDTRLPQVCISPQLLCDLTDDCGDR